MVKAAKTMSLGLLMQNFGSKWALPMAKHMPSFKKQGCHMTKTSRDVSQNTKSVTKTLDHPVLCLAQVSPQFCLKDAVSIKSIFASTGWSRVLVTVLEFCERFRNIFVIWQPCFLKLGMCLAISKAHLVPKFHIKRPKDMVLAALTMLALEGPF